MRTMKKMKKKTKKKEKKEIVTPQCLMLIAVLDQATELYYLKSNWMPPHWNKRTPEKKEKRNKKKKKTYWEFRKNKEILDLQNVKKSNELIFLTKFRRKKWEMRRKKG